MYNKKNHIQKNRAVIFVHYDMQGIIDDYVFFYISELKRISNLIVFVSTANLSSDVTNKISKMVDIVIKRENIGHDFFSYKVGLEKLISNVKYNFSEIVLCNDSVFGPLFPLKEMFESMSDSNSDFWGITESYEIKYHIQSYFMVFRNSVIKSKCFVNFWEKLIPLQDRNEIVEKYEVGLTNLLLRNGFSVDSYVKLDLLDLSLSYLRFILSKFKKIAKYILNPNTFTQNSISKKYNMFYPNPTFNLWKEIIIKHKCPFLKISLFKYHYYSFKVSSYEHVIKKYTNYDYFLINRYLNRYGIDITNIE